MKPRGPVASAQVWGRSSIQAHVIGWNSLAGSGQSCQEPRKGKEFNAPAYNSPLVFPGQVLEFCCVCHVSAWPLFISICRVLLLPFLIWCDLYSMTITFLALMSLLPPAVDQAPPVGHAANPLSSPRTDQPRFPRYVPSCPF